MKSFPPKLLPTRIPSDTFSQHSIECDSYSKKSSSAEKKLDSDGNRLIILDLIETNVQGESNSALDKNHVFWPGDQLSTRLKISSKGWEELEEIYWEVKGEVNTTRQRDDPMAQSSGGKQRRTIFKSTKQLKNSLSPDADLQTSKATSNGMSFPISVSLQNQSSSKEQGHEKIFIISSNLPTSLPKGSPAARGRTLSQRPSLPPTFRSSDRYSVVYSVKVWFRMKGSRMHTKLRIWKPFLVLPFSAFPTPDLDLPSLTSNPTQSPSHWRVHRKTSHFGIFSSSRRTITSNLAFPSPRYVSSKDWVPFFLYLEVKSSVKSVLASDKLPILPRKGRVISSNSFDKGDGNENENENWKGKGKGKRKENRSFEPQIILSRQDDSPASALGKSFAQSKRIPCEIEWISGSNNDSVNEDQEEVEVEGDGIEGSTSSRTENRGRNRNATGTETPQQLNDRNNNQDEGIGYGWTDIIKTSSEAATLLNDPSNPIDFQNGSSNFDGGEELLPRFSQLSFRSRSSSRRRSRVSTSEDVSDGLFPGRRTNHGRDGNGNGKEDAKGEIYYRSALLFGKIKTKNLTPGFGVPSLSVQYHWDLSWNVGRNRVISGKGNRNSTSKASGNGRTRNILEGILSRDKENLSMKLGTWLSSTGITREEFDGLSREEVERRVGSLT